MMENKKQPGQESGEDLDVRAVHGQLLREKSEPWEMLRAAPGWLKHGIYAPLCIWGLIYFFSASGGFSWSEYNEGPRSTIRKEDQIPLSEIQPELPTNHSNPGDLSYE